MSVSEQQNVTTMLQAIGFIVLAVLLMPLLQGTRNTFPLH